MSRAVQSRKKVNFGGLGRGGGPFSQKPRYRFFQKFAQYLRSWSSTCVQNFIEIVLAVFELVLIAPLRMIIYKKKQSSPSAMKIQIPLREPAARAAVMGALYGLADDVEKPPPHTTLNLLLDTRRRQFFFCSLDLRC